MYIAFSDLDDTDKFVEHCKQMKENPVDMPNYNRPENIIDVIEWIDESCKGNATVRHGKLWFDTKDDILLYKMRWM